MLLRPGGSVIPSSEVQPAGIAAGGPAESGIIDTPEGDHSTPVGTIIGLFLGLSGLAVILLFVTILFVQKRRRDNAEILEIGQGRHRAVPPSPPPPSPRGLAGCAAPMGVGGGFR